MNVQPVLRGFRRFFQRWFGQLPRPYLCERCKRKRATEYDPGLGKWFCAECGSEEFALRQW